MNKDYNAIPSRDEELPMVNARNNLKKKDWTTNTPLVLFTGLFLGVVFLAGQYSGGRGATAVISGILDERAMASFDDVCISGASIENLKEETMNILKRVDDHITPDRLKKLIGKLPALPLPSGVTKLEKNDDGDGTERMMQQCVRLDTGIVGPIDHNGSACIKDGSIVYNGCLRLAGNNLHCERMSIGRNSNFRLFRAPIPGGFADITLKATINGIDSFKISFCGEIDWWAWFMSDLSVCTRSFGP